MRELDRRTIADFHVPGEVLMDRAGRGVAEVVRRIAELRGLSACEVHVFAGRGNNGGDAFAAARYLSDWGFTVRLWLATAAAQLSGDALAHFRRMASGAALRCELAAEADWPSLPDERFRRADIAVDGLLGTGLSGPARGSVAAAIRLLNALGQHVPVVSIDVPSGLDADTGAATGAIVAADVTVTLGLPKRGLLEPRAADFVGNLEVADIGLPPELWQGLRSEEELIAAEELRTLLPRRARHAHKGEFGRVLIVSGAAGYAGAVTLAARAALRSGAGLVTALVPHGIAPVVAAGAPEAMVHAAAQTEGGSLSADCLRAWNRSLADFDAVLMGPGMTPHAETGSLVETILGMAKAGLVLDADALNVLAGRRERIRRCAGRVILTPHPGEMARLLGVTVAGVQQDRPGSARAIARDTGAVVVLKGAGTIVCAAGQPLHVNLTGNPGMAKGGMGDVLAGLMAGLVAQGLSSLDAARLGVYVHGRAADTVAWRGSQSGMTAGDVIEELPAALRALGGR